MTTGINSPDAPDKTVICHECENVVRIPQLEHKHKAHCPRCGLQLTVYHKSAMHSMIAYGLTALIFLALAIPFDFLSFKAKGLQQSIDLMGGMAILIEQGHWVLGAGQFIAIIALPAAILIGLLYLLIPLSFGISPPQGKFVLRCVFALLPWSMAEVFLIGTLVSLIKLSSLADIGLGMSFYAYIAFIVTMVITLLYVDRYHLQEMIGAQTPPPPPVNKEESIQKTWALLVTSVILYIPANTLPIMNTRYLGQDEPSTILGGVIVLWEQGSYPVASIIFIASVLVPIGKMVALALLNYSVQKDSDIKRKERVQLYRITEFVGRWSMVDVFVVAILVSLIQLGNAMSFYPGPAALAFCGVVILTMLAAMTFDARLIWPTNVDGRVNGE